MRTQSVRTASVFLASALVACTSAGDQNGHGDDAGARSAQEISPPATLIGHGEDEAQSLHRVFSGVLIEDGRIAVGNGGTGEIRVFHADGSHSFTTGSKGGGPGEFRGINWMRRIRGDSILVWDLASSRFSVLAPDATFVRTFRPVDTSGPVQPIGPLPDGSILIAERRSPDPRVQRGQARDTLVVSRLSLSGQKLDSVAKLPGSEWLFYEAGTNFSAIQLALGRRGHVAPGPGLALAYGSSEAAEIRILDLAGAPERTIRLPLEAPILSERERRSYLAAEHGDGEELRAVVRHLGSGESLDPPVFTSLARDSDGNLWVRSFAGPDEESAKWLRVTPDGDIAEFRFPADAHFLDARGRHVLLRELGPDEIHQVAVREIRR